MKTINSIRKLKLALLLGVCALIGSQTVHAQSQIFHVTVDTSALTAEPLSDSAPFGLDFQFNAGDRFSGLGSTSNTATISNFTLNGGSLTGSPFINSNTATGSLATSLSFSTNFSTNAFNDYTQNFDPGASLSFDVMVSDSALTKFQPDGFIFSIVNNNTDNFGDFIPTTDPSGTSLVDIDIGPTEAVIQPITEFTYQGANDEVLGDYSGVTVTVQAVPEPSIWAMLIGGLSAMVFFVRRQREA